LSLTGQKWREAGENCITKEFCNLYSSPNVIGVVKSRNMRWAGHVAHVKDNERVVWDGTLEGKRSHGLPRNR